MTARLGVGVLGAHAWAEKAHLPGYAACPRVRRVALCDTVRGRAEALAARFAFERVYDDARDLLADPDVQRVLQTSFIAVGNDPGIELRVYGSRGAAIARLVVEDGRAETLHAARAEAVEFQPVALAPALFPPGTDLRMPWPELYDRSLVLRWADEILDGARAQEIVDALVLSHMERRWVSLPLCEGVR